MSQPNAAVPAVSLADLQAENAKLREALASKASASISCKVSDKGAVSVYGLGRFPVTLYGSQWDRLLGHADTIKSFLTANRDKLAVKH